MAFLDAQSRTILFDPPDVYEEALARYALSAEDIAFAKAHRRSHNRLGFAIQLALVRDLGRPLRAGEVPPQAVVSVVANQLGIDAAVFALYAQREETRREHTREIVVALDLGYGSALIMLFIAFVGIVSTLQMWFARRRQP
ncbi:DUF4158 domain-containing protein [Rhizobium mongolense]|uniref:DUF4158 domain-containing protein n=1 Tax=Rhizobium mongolense TaxID=57676 RepID=UPI0035585667